MCLYPKLIINRKYIPNIKNKGTPPQIKDERTKYVPVGCGQCMECRKQKKRQWQVRLQEEIRINKIAQFVTLSFREESLTELEEIINKDENKLTDYALDNEIATIAVRRFLERWRKSNGKSIKHWLVTELGQTKTERLHIHGIIFTDSKTEIEQQWQYGNVWIGTYVNERTVNYIVKYINKIDPLHRYYTPKILTSKGIGRNYMTREDSQNNKYKDKETKDIYTTRQGIKLPLPIYYRNKIYTEEQREKLWTQRLDKQERYVNGIKIDVSKDYTEYDEVIKEQRLINKQLGYGSNEIDKERKKYEQDRRNIQRLTRIKKQEEEGF